MSSTSVGQVGIFGAQGSGKTRIIQTLCQYYELGDRYSWDEEKEMLGTTGVFPFILPTRKGKLTVMDNPGQDNLDMIRSIVAQAGAGYKGLLIVVDDAARIFAPVSMSHADAITPFAKVQEGLKIPVGIISNKSDFSDMLKRKGIVKELAAHIESRLQRIMVDNSCQVKYYNRVYGKWDTREVQILRKEGVAFVKYTDFEQILVEILDDVVRDLLLSPEDQSPLTKMNIRLIARAFSMGFYSLLLDTKVSEADSMAFGGIGPSLYICLNHHRPTFWETGITWKDILNTKEPFMPLDVFSADNIRAIFIGKMLGNEDVHNAFVRQCQHNNRWNIVGHARTNVFEAKGEKLAQVIEAVAYGITENETKSSQVETFDLDGF